MHITTERFIGFVAIAVAASYVTYGMESLTAVHPAVRRGIQVAIMAATTLWTFHAIQSL